MKRTNNATDRLWSHHNKIVFNRARKLFLAERAAKAGAIANCGQRRRGARWRCATIDAVRLCLRAANKLGNVWCGDADASSAGRGPGAHTFMTLAQRRPLLLTLLLRRNKDDIFVEERERVLEFAAIDAGVEQSIPITTVARERERIEMAPFVSYSSSLVLVANFRCRTAH